MDLCISNCSCFHTAVRGLAIATAKPRSSMPFPPQYRHSR